MRNLPHYGYPLARSLSHGSRGARVSPYDRARSVASIGAGSAVKELYAIDDHISRNKKAHVEKVQVKTAIELRPDSLEK